jgi:hypothetical protein
MQKWHKDRDLKRQLGLKTKRAFNKTVIQTFGLEVVKRVVGISIRLQGVSDCIVEESALSKTKEETSKTQPEIEDDGGTLWPARNLSENRFG